MLRPNIQHKETILYVCVVFTYCFISECTFLVLYMHVMVTVAKSTWEYLFLIIEGAECFCLKDDVFLFSLKIR